MKIRKIVFLMLVLAILLPAVCLADLEIHYLYVGQGDCALLVADGEAMIIDGGSAYWNRKVQSYIRKTLGISEFKYMVATHPHEDHVGGLIAAMNAAPADVLITPVTEAADLPAFQDLMAYAEMTGTQIVVPEEYDRFSLGKGTVTILSRWPDAWCENDLSLVIRVDYGESSFLFTGDAEEYLEYILIDNCREMLDADVLKVGHHGSLTSSSEEFLRAVSPEYAVISSGNGNTYRHPRQDTLRKLADTGAEIFRTDLQGNVVFRTDGKVITAGTEKTAKYESILVSPEMNLCADLPEGSYVGNRNSMKYHLPECEYGQAISERNLIVFENREAVLAAGYAPCGICRP